MWQQLIDNPDLHPWLVILGGLAIGVMARWAVLQSMNQPCGWREVRVDMMILLMNGLLAAQFASAFDLNGTKLAVAAAMFGASSTMVFAKIHGAFVEKVVKTAIFVGPDQTTSIPAAIPPPVEVHSVGKQTAQSVPERLIQVFKQADPPTDEQIEDYLRRLGSKDDE